MDIGFAPNYTTLNLIDITPTASDPTWAYLGPGIVTVELDSDETVDDTQYYDGGGVAYNEVTGIALGYSVSGDRKFGDAAQDFICGLLLETGEGRKTRFKRIMPDGRAFEGGVTVTDIVDGGGDADSKGTFSCSLKFNGIPEFTSPTKTSMPESVTASDLSVVKDETEAVGATVTPNSASNTCVYAIKDTSVATVDMLGNVTGVAVGTTELTIKSVVKPSVVKTIGVTVTSL